MARHLLKFALAVVASTSLNAFAAGSMPPKVFNDLNVTMQSRVCGELLTDLAVGGMQALQQESAGRPVPKASRGPVYDTGAKGILLLTMAGSLKLEDRLKAGEVAAAIDKMDPQVHVDTALFCQRRIKAWLVSGEVDSAMVTSAHAQAKQLVDKVLDGPTADE